MKQVLIPLLIVFAASLSVACAQQDTTTIQLLKDRDALIERIKPLDNIVGVENAVANVSYKQALLSFINDELKKTTETFQTIYNEQKSRSMVVTTKDGTIYKVVLNRSNQYWKVSGYTKF